MERRLLPVLVLLALLTGCAEAYAQHPQRHGRGDDRMSRDERQRLRDEMNSTRREVYKDGGQRRNGLPPAGGRMSDAERDKLRRDMMDANRGMPRR